jgi:hypothetical protein
VPLLYSILNSIRIGQEKNKKILEFNFSYCYCLLYVGTVVGSTVENPILATSFAAS